ncbi:MAG: hypothetical protein LKM40_02460 [Mageeibacillus sp.]|jgi:hypothetical protein|nr:hypothetical protein [Mageeibacillus sp.]
MSFSSRGSITLETAVTFSIAIVFIASIASIVNFYRTDIIIKRAAAQVCEKNTLVMPLSVTASDYMSTAINAFPDLGIDNSDSSKVISTVAQIMTGADIAGGYSVEMLVSEEIYGGHIADDISDYYVEHNGGSDFFLPDVIDVSLEYDRDNNCIGVYVEYSIVTMVGHIGRCVYDVIPVYGSNDMFFNAAQSPDDSGDIWEKNNFDRGDSFREIYGSNLPKTFPVIDSYSAGEATSLVSMDSDGSDVPVFCRYHGISI